MRNIFSFFHRKTDLDRQMDEFFCYKAFKSLPVAENNLEWVRVFARFTRHRSVFDVTYEDLENYNDYLSENYASDYQKVSAMRSANSFLRFFRCGIMFSMKRVGRPANGEAIEMVKGFRQKGLTYREIAAVLKSKGMTDDLKIIHFWSKHSLK